MTFRFFPRLPVIVRTLCVAWLAAAVSSPAQSPAVPASPAASPQGSPKKLAYLRILNLLPLDGGSLDIVPTNSANGNALKTVPPSNFYMGYFEMPPVRTGLQVFRAGNRTTPVKAVDVPLHADAYYTILCYLKPDGQMAVDLLDENPDPTKPPVNRLTVRQFKRGAQITVAVSNGPKTDEIPYAGAQTLEGLKDGVLPMTASISMQPDTPPLPLSLEANFTKCRRVTIYVVTDPYNRLRPQMSFDGPSRAEEDAIRSRAGSSNTAPAR